MQHKIFEFMENNNLNNYKAHNLFFLSRVLLVE